MPHKFSRKNIKKRWKPMPVSLKNLFGITLLLYVWDLITSIIKNDLIFIGESSFIIWFGIEFSGSLSMIIQILIYYVLPIIFLIVIWNRYSWSWIFGIIYYGLIMGNELVTSIYLFTFSGKIFLGGISNMILNLVLLSIILSNKKYLTQKNVT